jgi:hypothetical protein
MCHRLQLHSIQAALSASPKAITIQVKAGTYQENVTISGSPSAPVTTLNLVGDGPDQTILQGNVLITDAQLVSVTGFTVQSQGVHVQDSGTVTLFNNALTGGIGNGLSISNSGMVTVQSNAIKANHGSGVMLAQGSKAALSANAITGNGGDGIGLENAQALATDNTIQSNAGCGIRADSSSQLAGGGNMAGGNAGGDACGNVPSGIFTSTAPSTPASCTVTVGPSGPDTIQQVINTAASGAVICLSAGTFSQDISIDKNLSLRGTGRDQTVLTGTSDTGITIGGSAQVTIQGMTISGFSCAMVSVRDSAQATMQESRLSINTQACPILEVAGSAQVTVRNSEISGSLEDGIDVSSSAVRVHLIQNTISDNRDDAIYLTERANDPATIAECRGNAFANNGGGISNNDEVVKKCSTGQ